MKRTMALLFVLMLVVGLAALPVCAETVKGESDTVEAPVLTIGEGVPADVEMESNTSDEAEKPVMGEMEVVTVYGEEEPVMGETTTVTVYGEEEAGFFGWLKNLWNSILEFFGL